MMRALPLALAAALLAPAARAQGFGLSFGPGIEAMDVTPAMLPAGTWSLAATPRTFLAAARATAVRGLQDAFVTVECVDGRGGPERRVWVAYWLPGTTDPGDEYRLDLFNSAGSGRPAYYDLGAGRVGTAGTRFPMNEPPPPAYGQASQAFVAGLAALPDGAEAEVGFALPGGADAALRIPATGFDAVAEGLAAGEACP